MDNITDDQINSYTFFHIFKVVQSDENHPHFKIGKFFKREMLDKELISLVPLDPEDEQVVRKYKPEVLVDDSKIVHGNTVLKNAYQFYKEKQ